MSSVEMAQVKLIGSWASSFSYRIIWALKHKGESFECIEEDLSNKSETLLQYNPVHKKVPVLVHAGKPVAESTVILEYIEETWPQKPLLSKNPFKRAQARFWIKFGEDNEDKFFAIFHTVGEEQVKATKEAKKLLKVIEEHGLGKKKFFGGAEIGLTDIVYGWIACWLEFLEEAAEIKLLEPDCFPHLQAWVRNFKEVPVIKENLPDREALLAYYRQLRYNIVARAT